MSIKNALIGFMTGVLNGLFGSGGGTVAVPAMERFLLVEDKKAHATAIAVILPLSVVSLFIYMGKVDIDWKTVFAVSVYVVLLSFKKVSKKLKFFGIFCFYHNLLFYSCKQKFD